jgi:outer membrane protein assembly factor BamB
MNCTEFNQKIELFVLGELSKSEEAAIKEHITTCPVCDATEAEYRLLVTKIKETVQPIPSKPALIYRVYSTVKIEIRSIMLRSLIRRIITITGLAAACLLLVFVIQQIRTFSINKERTVVTKNLSKKPLDRASFVTGVPSISEAWQYKSVPSVPQSIADEAVVCGQNMYLLQEHNRQTFVAALDINTGKQKWFSDTHSCGYLLADDSHVYCLSPGGAGKLDLIALDATSGETLWKYQQQYTENQQNPCRPTLLSEGRICWTNNKTVHMINSANGKSLWAHSISGGSLLSSAVAVNNDLYVANSLGFYCLNATTGKQSWRLNYGSVISSRSRPLLAAADSVIYASLSPGLGTSSRLICMELKGHRIRWSKTVSHITHLYANNAMLYIRNQNIQALDEMTGRLLWNCPATGCNPVTYIEGLAYFVDSSSQGCLKALDMYTGNKVWELGGVKSCNAFIKVNGTGFLKSQEGIVYAINLKG